MDPWAPAVSGGAFRPLHGTPPAKIMLSTADTMLGLPCFEATCDRTVCIKEGEATFLPESSDKSGGRQAISISDLMAIRAVHGKLFHRLSLGTALGFRIQKSQITNIPAIIVFVARKLDAHWVRDGELLPRTIQDQGPGLVWCDVDVVELSWCSMAMGQNNQVNGELVELLRGNDHQIGPGSQVSSAEAYGTLGALVRSEVGKHEVGFITNKHIAADIESPYQKFFHPLPPNLGPGMYLGAVERDASFISDHLWYGMYAGSKSTPDTFVRADCAFVPFRSSIHSSRLTTAVRGIGEIGEIIYINLGSHIGSVVGKPVMKVGRSSGLTRGTILAYGFEYRDENDRCCFTDLFVVGDDHKGFDVKGDSGSLIFVGGENGGKARPIGMIWGGTSFRGCLKLHEDREPENWTTGVDLGRLLKLLQVKLLACDVALEDAWREQHQHDEETDICLHLSLSTPCKRTKHLRA